MSAKILFEKSHIDKVVKDWTIDKMVDYKDNDILIFIDDTGEEKLSKDHYVYGLGGCIMLGKDYDVIKSSWNKIRNMGQKEFGVPASVAFHAAKHCHKGPKQRMKHISEFMKNSSFGRFFHMVDVHTLAEPGLKNYISPVIDGVNHQVSLLLGEYSDCAYWILEKSNRQSPAMIEAMFQNAVLFRHPGSGNNQIFFLEKKTIEPGLEWADIIAWSEGTRLRDALLGRTETSKKFSELHEATFGDKSKSVSERTGGFFGPITVSNS